jgi:hypothetical protein
MQLTDYQVIHEVFYKMPDFDMLIISQLQGHQTSDEF